MEQTEPLESKVEFGTVSNEVVTGDSENRVGYVARVDKIWLDGKSVRGRLTLWKYNQREKTVRRIVASTNPLELRMLKVPISKRKTEWKQTCGDAELKEDGLPGKYFIIDGKTSDHYRQWLGKLLGVSKKVYLSDELMNRLFNPIDEQIMAKYKEVVK